MKVAALFFSLFLSFHLFAGAIPLDSYDDISVGYGSTNNIDEIYHMVGELEEIGAPVNYIRKALSALSGISFKAMPAEATGVYNSLTNWVSLPYDFQDQRTHKLKKLIDLTDDQVSTIYHELWHCYRAKVLPADNPAMLSYWSNRARILYPNNNNSFHDEAWALFIDKSITNYLSIYKLMAKKDFAGRERLRVADRFTGIYQRAINEQIFGYYRSRWGGRFVNTTVNFPMEDRQYIIRTLLEGKITYTFQPDFSEDRF